MVLLKCHISLRGCIPTMEREKNDPQNALNCLVDMYKVAEENHRFYIANRFIIMSLYFPLMSLILSGIYFLGGLNSRYQIMVSICGIVLTLFLYSIEYRNWILSNICLHNSKEIGKKINGNYNLHLKLVNSHNLTLPEGSTFFDKSTGKIIKTQHKAVLGLTVFLLFYWISLATIQIFL